MALSRDPFNDPAVEAYTASLGKFLHRFAYLEGELQRLLWSESHVDEATATAVFSGVRTLDAIGRCRRIWEAHGIEPSAMLLRAFGQIEVLNGVRNAILHFGARFERDELVVANWRAHTKKVASARPISAEILNQMTADLITIEGALIAHFMTYSVGRGQEIREQFLRAAQAPWRYTPPRRDHSQNKTL